MSLQIESKNVDDVAVLDLKGRIVLGEDSTLLREAIRDLASRGQKNILLNLANVNYIDSGGLGALVSAYVSLANQQGKLKLLNLTRRVHDLLQITKLLTVFEVFEQEAEAISSFAPKAAAR